MDTRSEEHIDKTDWPDGPWKSEPDDVTWRDPTTGLLCRAVRIVHREGRFSWGGYWYGYVGLPPGHPFYRISLFDADQKVTVHGGVTYAEQRSAPLDSFDPETAGLWLVGFDCAHADDLAPLGSGYELSADWPEGAGTYCTLDYVREQCAELARQLGYLGNDALPSIEDVAGKFDLTGGRNIQDHMDRLHGHERDAEGEEGTRQ